MNYRHAYHAGNFADVFKHVILTRIIEYLKQKDKAFRVIDTHAGIGLYDLDTGEAAKTGEWQSGAAKVLDAKFTAKAADLLAPWLKAVRSVNSDKTLRKYPGSPKLTKMLLRKQDRLSAIELHPEDARALAKQFEDDYQVRVIELDGWLALGAHLPPKEKRGLVLVDPPFEDPSEFNRIVTGLRGAHARWPGGIYAFWYPIKDRKSVIQFRKDLKATGIPKILDTELYIRGPSPVPQLDGTGMIIVNPPYTLESELKLILPELAAAMQEDKAGFSRVEWIAGEQTAA
ncbi:MAG: 23S rRNA (adenine(2030)-N(6))-methyltransferase RlmJ [Rhizobiaceae bacterium]